MPHLYGGRPACHPQRLRMTHRYSSAQFIPAFALPCCCLGPTAPIIRGSLSTCDTHRIGATKSKEGIGRVLKPAHRARGMLSQTCVLYTLFYHFR